MATISRKWLLALVYVGVLAALSELCAYAIVSSFDNKLGNASQRHLYSPVRGHELNPTYHRQFDTGGVRIHSSQGFRRDGWISKAKPADTLRIFMLGGSTLYGLGVQSDATYPKHPSLRNDETVPYFLEQTVNRHLGAAGLDMRVEVINAGVTAYQTYQHVQYVLETLYEYDPDILLFLDGHNDFYNVDELNPIKNYGYSASVLLPALNRRDPFFTLYMAARLPGQYSYTFKLIEKASLKLLETHAAKPHNSAQSIRLPAGDFQAALQQAADVGFIRNYRMIGALARHHGFAFHVFLQPEVVFEQTGLLDTEDRAIQAITERSYGNERVALMKRARPLFPALFDQVGIAFTDLGTIAGPGTRTEQLYLDYCHLSPAGSQAVAERMLPVVLEMIAAHLDRDRLIGQTQLEQRAS